MNELCVKSKGWDMHVVVDKTKGTLDLRLTCSQPTSISNMINNLREGMLNIDLLPEEDGKFYRSQVMSDSDKSIVVAYTAGYDEHECIDVDVDLKQAMLKAISSAIEDNRRVVRNIGHKIADLEELRKELS